MLMCLSVACYKSSYTISVKHFLFLFKTFNSRFASLTLILFKKNQNSGAQILFMRVDLRVELVIPAGGW